MFKFKTTTTTTTTTTAPITKNVVKEKQKKLWEKQGIRRPPPLASSF